MNGRKKLTYGLVVASALTGGVALFYANRPKQIGPDLETFVELMEGVNERYLAIGITDVPYTNFYVSPSYMMHYIHEMPTYIESLASYYLYYTNGQWRPIAFEGRNKLFELAGIGPGGGTSGWNYVFTPDAGNKWMEIEDMWWLSRYWGKHLGSVPWTGFLWECYRALSVMTATSATIYYDQSDIIYGDRYVYFRDDRPMPMAYHEEEGGQPPPWWTNLNLLADFSNMLVITVPPLPDSAWPAVQTNTFWGERFMFEGVVMAHTDYDWNGLQTQYWAIAYGTNWLWDQQQALRRFTFSFLVTGVHATLWYDGRSWFRLSVANPNDTLYIETNFCWTNTIDFITQPTNVIYVGPAKTNSWDWYDWRNVTSRGKWRRYPNSYNHYSDPIPEIYGRYDHTIPFGRPVVLWQFRRCRPRDSQQ